MLKSACTDSAVSSHSPCINSPTGVTCCNVPEKRPSQTLRTRARNCSWEFRTWPINSSQSRRNAASSCCSFHASPVSQGPPACPLKKPSPTFMPFSLPPSFAEWEEPPCLACLVGPAPPPPRPPAVLGLPHSPFPPRRPALQTPP